MTTTLPLAHAAADRYLRPDAILLDVDLRSVAHTIEFAASSIALAHGLDAAPVARALARREQVGSTGIGRGVALPHARVTGIAHPLLMFLRARPAIDFAAADGLPVSLILVILVPAHGDPEVHLQLLAAVAEAFADRDFRARLLAAPDPDAARAVFAQWATNFAISIRHPVAN